MSEKSTVLATEAQFSTPMGEDDAKAFFKKHKIKNYNEAVWIRGLPLLYIFQDSLKKGIFRNLPVRPTLARIDNPVEVAPGGIQSQGQVDYYIIDFNTYKISRVWSSNSFPDKKEYSIESPHRLLFFEADHLFPKGPRVEK